VISQSPPRYLVGYVFRGVAADVSVTPAGIVGEEADNPRVSQGEKGKRNRTRSTD